MEAFQVRIFQIAQATDGLFLVSFEQGPRAGLCAKFGIERFDTGWNNARRKLAPPKGTEQFLLVTFCFLVSHGQQKAWAQSGDVVGFASGPKIAQVVADLVGDAERFTVN